MEQTEHDLKERIKELNCLYGISKLSEDRDVSIHDLLEGVVTRLIPAAFQYPEVTVARITYDNAIYKTSNFKETRWKLSASSQAAGKSIQLDVFYLQENEFLVFETYLIKDVCNRLKVIIENREEFKKQLLDSRVKALTEQNEQLVVRVMERGTLSDIDPVDRQIITLLSKDGRMKLVDIGEQLVSKDKQGYSHVGVQNRLTKLVASEAIAIQANVNLKKYNAVIGLLLIETSTLEAALEIVKEFKDCTRILFSFRAIGKYNLVFSILGENIEDLETFINESSPRMAPGVRDSLVIVSTTFYTPKFFPTRYLDKDGSKCKRFLSGACSGCLGMAQ
nr:Lrp/AsnC family transcriptional regulator [Candidatus Sigynarchaeota archaeon]